jgi:hypothetical protein
VSASVPEGTDVRRFTPTSGTASGWVGVTLAGLAVVLALLGDHSVRGVRFALAAAVFGLLVWCFMLRPRLVIGPSVVELRNPFNSWHVPLASVRKVSVRAVTRVHTDDRRYDGVAVGRPVRSLMRARPARQQTIGLPGLGGVRLPDDPDAARVPKGQLDADMVADFVVEHILLSADRARSTPDEPPAPRRSWAWPEIVMIAVLVAGLLVSLAL